ncbi:MAG: hypothetical protein ABI977_07900 [Acidobacteriota bacterium]
MPPLNLLLLPLLGGFLFVTLWHPTKYYTLRADGYRLIFFSSIAGAFFMFVACVVATSAPWIFNLLWLPALAGKIDLWWHLFVPYENTGRAALAFMIGAVIWFPLNKIKACKEDAAIKRMINHKRDALETLLSQALAKGRMVSVTVKSGKVYIGVITSNFNPAYDLNSLSLLPAFSGYRDNDQKEVHLMRDYTTAYQDIRTELQAKLQQSLPQIRLNHPKLSDAELGKLVREKLEAEDRFENFEITIPISEVQTVNIFDVDVYEKHFKLSGKDAATAQ